ncbi:hypothetical protein DPMN_125073 [Dreissena polymorpha]|uniref:Uncharacterized protein n=1 Tax=Dreissena polymorpha TaxID=45954 RepID=A0A9D4GXK1_DREPO|nr:hypothetical protein DPMN_125073 [Dreissena polymorpha]
MEHRTSERRLLSRFSYGGVRKDKEKEHTDTYRECPYVARGPGTSHTVNSVSGTK